MPWTLIHYIINCLILYTYIHMVVYALVNHTNQSGNITIYNVVPNNKTKAHTQSKETK